jgi:hypothetical protein
MNGEAVAELYLLRSNGSPRARVSHFPGEELDTVEHSGTCAEGAIAHTRQTRSL